MCVENPRELLEEDPIISDLGDCGNWIATRAVERTSQHVNVQELTEICLEAKRVSSLSLSVSRHLNLTDSSVGIGAWANLKGRSSAFRVNAIVRNTIALVTLSLLIPARQLMPGRPSPAASARATPASPALFVMDSQCGSSTF